MPFNAFRFYPRKMKKRKKSESQTICVDVLYISASVFGNFFLSLGQIMDIKRQKKRNIICCKLPYTMLFASLLARLLSCITQQYFLTTLTEIFEKLQSTAKQKWRQMLVNKKKISTTYIIIFLPSFYLLYMVWK